MEEWNSPCIKVNSEYTKDFNVNIRPQHFTLLKENIHKTFHDTGLCNKFQKKNLIAQTITPGTDKYDHKKINVSEYQKK